MYDLYNTPDPPKEESPFALILFFVVPIVLGIMFFVGAVLKQWLSM